MELLGVLHQVGDELPNMLLDLFCAVVGANPLRGAPILAEADQASALVGIGLATHCGRILVHLLTASLAANRATRELPEAPSSAAR